MILSQAEALKIMRLSMIMRMSTFALGKYFYFLQRWAKMYPSNFITKRLKTFLCY